MIAYSVHKVLDHARLAHRILHGPIYVCRRDSKASKYAVPRVVVSTPDTAPSRTLSMRRVSLSIPVTFACCTPSIHKVKPPLLAPTAVEARQSSSMECGASLIVNQPL